MTRARETSAADVFINCPFDKAYRPTFDAIVFVLVACDYHPRSALEIDNGALTRIERLYDLIHQCKFGIHDLSRTELDEVNQLPRFNMPLELGIFLGARRFGGKRHADKRALILDTVPYRYQKFISDLAGMDIHVHGGAPEMAMRETRDWLASFAGRPLPAAPELIARYEQFRLHLTDLGQARGFRPEELLWADYLWIVGEWLVAMRSTDPETATTKPS